MNKTHIVKLKVPWVRKQEALVTALLLATTVTLNAVDAKNAV